MVASRVEVDGQSFQIHLAHPDASLEVDTSTGARVRLRRWRFDEHLRALDRHAGADARGLQFDHEGFSRDLLRDSDVPESLHAELAPLALWWSTGGAQLVCVPGPEGWLRIGALQVRLRPWTLAERSQALRSSLVSGPGGGQELGLERYLRAMLTASVVALEPAGVELAMLDGATTAVLLDAVVALNTAGEGEEAARPRTPDAEDRALAQVTLRLCRVLGWTPSRVWATPAAEIDRLLALVDLVEGPAQAAASTSRPPGLADHPDAVVIQVEEG